MRQGANEARRLHDLAKTSGGCPCSHDAPSECIIGVLLATIDRQSEQLATAREALEWLADLDAECLHMPEHIYDSYEDPVTGCMAQVAAEALAAIDAAAQEESEEPWEDAAMRAQSEMAFKAVVESANDVLIAYDRFVSYEQIGDVMEKLRAVLHGPLRSLASGKLSEQTGEKCKGGRASSEGFKS